MDQILAKRSMHWNLTINDGLMLFEKEIILNKQRKIYKCVHSWRILQFDFFLCSIFRS